MKILNKLIGTICISIALISSAQANLIENGSFEIVADDSSSSGYTFYSSFLGWKSSKSIEIWNDNFIVDAYDGSNILELNSKFNGENDSFAIFQDFSTVIGEVYELTFWGHKRQKNQNEGFSVSVGDLSESIYNQAWGDWNEYSFLFTADSTTSTLTFTSLDGARDTTGNLLDAVSVIAAPASLTKSAPIPEPSILMLMVLGIAGIFASRKKFNL